MLTVANTQSGTSECSTSKFKVIKSTVTDIDSKTDNDIDNDDDNGRNNNNKPKFISVIIYLSVQ